VSTQPQGQKAAQSGDDGGMADILTQMVQGLGETVRREVEDLRSELTERAAGGAKGAALLTGAGAAGTVALAAAASLPLMALRRVLPGWVIASLIAGGAGTGAFVLARRGLSELAEAAPVDADRIKDAAREAVRSIP
jgi:hypothetical protein